MGAQVKIQVENGLGKYFNFQVQIINTSDQSIFTLKYSGLHDEEGKKINKRDLLTASQRQLSRFLSFMMAVHLDQADPNCKHSCMTCRAYVQLPLHVDVIGASINTQMLEKPHYLLVHLVAFDNWRKQDIGTLKKDKGDIFSGYFTEISKEKILWCVNEVLFGMVKTVLKDTYLGGTTPTALQNEVATCQ